MYDWKILQQTISATPPQTVAEVCAAVAVAGGTPGAVEVSSVGGGRWVQVLGDTGKAVDYVWAGTLPD